MAQVFTSGYLGGTRITGRKPSKGETKLGSGRIANAGVKSSDTFNIIENSRNAGPMVTKDDSTPNQHEEPYGVKSTDSMQ